ncbi:uncharacterized protein LOC135480713 isoform X2 [Liolophura sinensis]|uniref:uncharacterized protein LOC135480713 isoform X2 n=1 Tax=Liolophura sinensis TaxID=3198878 RepID=UPI003158C637
MLSMSSRRLLIICLLIACSWSLANSKRRNRPKFQKGEGRCDKGQVCGAGCVCRTEVITKTSRFPKCNDIRSEVIARTEEWKNATLRGTIANTTLSDFYTNNTWFFYQGVAVFRGPPVGRTESRVKGIVSVYNWWVLGEFNGSPSILTVEDILYLSEDLVIGLNLIEATSRSTGFGAAYELVLWRREEGNLKAEVQTLSFVPRPRPEEK